MNHNHIHCNHSNLKYCQHCNVAYCVDCNQEWPSYKYIYNTYGSGVGTYGGGNTLTSTPTNLTLTNTAGANGGGCQHG